MSAIHDLFLPLEYNLPMVRRLIILFTYETQVPRRTSGMW